MLSCIGTTLTKKEFLGLKKTPNSICSAEFEYPRAIANLGYNLLDFFSSKMILDEDDLDNSKKRKGFKPSHKQNSIATTEQNNFKRANCSAICVGKHSIEPQIGPAEMQPSHPK